MVNGTRQELNIQKLDMTKLRILLALEIIVTERALLLLIVHPAELTHLNTGTVRAPTR